MIIIINLEYVVSIGEVRTHTQKVQTKKVTVEETNRACSPN